MRAELLDTARGLAGGQVTVAGGPIAALQQPLLPGEAELVRRAVPSRRDSFAAGRCAARAALAALGQPPGPILRGTHGAPLWPEGIVGSITHSAALCLAVAARRAESAGLGVDIEPDRVLPPGIIAEIVTPEDDAAQNPAAPLRIFSAKEAVYKAQYPLSGRVIGFDAVSIRFCPSGFVATWREDCPPFQRGRTIAGRQTVTCGHVLSLVILPA